MASKDSWIVSIEVKKDEGNITLNFEAAFACGSLQYITRTSSCGLLLLFVCSERVSHLLRLSKVPILQLQTTANYCTVSEIYPGEENGTIRFFSQEATSAPTAYNHTAALLNRHVHRSCATMEMDYLFSSAALARSQTTPLLHSLARQMTPSRLCRASIRVGAGGQVPH